MGVTFTGLIRYEDLLENRAMEDVLGAELTAFGHRTEVAAAA